MASAGQRLNSVLGHLNPVAESGREKLLRKNKDDIVGSNHILIN
jgi:acetyl-CoA acyltransferase 1